MSHDGRAGWQRWLEDLSNLPGRHLRLRPTVVPSSSQPHDFPPGDTTDSILAWAPDARPLVPSPIPPRVATPPPPPRPRPSPPRPPAPHPADAVRPPLASVSASPRTPAPNAETNARGDVAGLRHFLLQSPRYYNPLPPSLRRQAWLLLVLTDQPPEGGTPADPSTNHALHSHRSHTRPHRVQYATWCRDLALSRIGSHPIWSDMDNLDETTTCDAPVGSNDRTDDDNDHPLALGDDDDDDDAPRSKGTWAAYFDQRELLEQIILDVQRQHDDIADDSPTCTPSPRRYHDDDPMDPTSDDDALDSSTSPSSFSSLPLSPSRLVRALFLQSTRVLPRMGYVQGMHEILATLLQIMRDEADAVETFRCLVTHDPGFRRLLGEAAAPCSAHDHHQQQQLARHGDRSPSSFSRPTSDFSWGDVALEERLRAEDPALYHHLRHHLDISFAVFTTLWWRTWFARVWPRRLLLAKWDVLFAHPPDQRATVLVNEFGYEWLRSHRDEILKTDRNEIGGVLRCLRGDGRGRGGGGDGGGNSGGGGGGTIP